MTMLCISTRFEGAFLRVYKKAWNETGTELSQSTLSVQVCFTESNRALHCVQVL
jgi:hypothetical protein